jgi:hypothetical protein
MKIKRRKVKKIAKSGKCCSMKIYMKGRILVEFDL